MAKRDIIAIGGSAGSNAPLKRLIHELPRDFDASVFITTHVPSTHHSYLPDLLQREGGLPVRHAEDGLPIERGCAYVAAPDRHLLLVDGTIRLGSGPRENMARPAIDPMFRSAALSHGSRVVGVVLSGRLNDGASGLYAIKSVDGTAVVQHPLDAAEDQMPCAALAAVEADHVARASELADLLVDLARSDAAPSVPPGDSLRLEVDVAAGAGLGSERLRDFAAPVAITCPDCGGVLSEVHGQAPLRYRCQIGHAYTAEELAAKDEKLNDAVRVAMRVMEERLELVRRMARDASRTGRMAVARLYEQRAEEYAGYAATLREAALRSVRTPPRPEPDN